jgi:nucleoside-diphosphate-sugar epimerase
VAISGASGYLGGVIRDRLRGDGWRTIDLVRTVRGADCRRYEIGGEIASDLLVGVDVLIHCAYDMTLRTPDDIWRVNVAGSRRLLESARDAEVRRTIVLSSMSAFDGTAQLYGQSKLEIEKDAARLGACSVRPGLVYGRRAGGMAGTLARLACLPVVPLISTSARQFTVHEDDFADAIAALVKAEEAPTEPVGVANPVGVPFWKILERFAAEQGRRCRFVPIDWRVVRAILVLAEGLGVNLPVRSDSLLGLVHPASFVPNLETLQSLGIRLRRFGQAVPPKPAAAMFGL